MTHSTRKPAPAQTINYRTFKQRGGIEGFRKFFENGTHSQLIIQFDNSLRVSLIAVPNELLEIQVRGGDSNALAIREYSLPDGTKWGTDAEGISRFSYENADANLSAINQVKVAPEDRKSYDPGRF